MNHSLKAEGKKIPQLKIFIILHTEYFLKKEGTGLLMLVSVHLLIFFLFFFRFGDN